MTVFSVASIDAYAIDLPSGGRFLTQQETLEFIGAQIPVTYFDGTDYQTTVATYNTAVTGNSGSSEYSTSPVGYVVDLNSPRVWLEYSIPAVAANNNSSYTTFHLQPTYSIFDTTYVYTAFAMTYGSNAPSSAVYNAPRSDWYIGGTIHHYENTATYSANSENYARCKITGNINTVYVPISFSSQSTFSAYAVDCSFYGTGGSGTRSFYVMCPYISSNASGASGTFSDTSAGPPVSGTGDINVDVDIDLTETNGILGSILTGISGIGDTILHLFVPTEEQMQDFYDDMSDMLDDTFIGYSDSTDILDDIRSTMGSAVPVTTLTFPAITVQGYNIIPETVVSLTPLDFLIEYIKIGFDLLATCAFINLIRLKFDEIILGKTVVEVAGDDEVIPS